MRFDCDHPDDPDTVRCPVCGALRTLSGWTPATSSSRLVLAPWVAVGDTFQWCDRWLTVLDVVDVAKGGRRFLTERGRLHYRDDESVWVAISDD